MNEVSRVGGKLGFAAIAGAIAVGILAQFLYQPAIQPTADAPRAVGLNEACATGSRRGHIDLGDELRTSSGLRIWVRTPHNYNATTAYPLLVIFAPAGFDRHRSESFYNLTTEATRRGNIVAYSDHVSLSRRALELQSAVASTIEQGYCVDQRAIAYLGHSDGGSMAEGIPIFATKQLPVRAVVATAAGIAEDDLQGAKCPGIPAVLIIHNPADELFPDFGSGTAAWWANCARCTPIPDHSLVSGCRSFKGCAAGKSVTYCSSATPHRTFPKMVPQMLNFIENEELNVVARKHSAH
ncbi:hypothetical protein C1T17_20565 (plasmid) [Sphingobium sp. SCG-1]|uniref:hypothetical protein n=1 Tax=Sphingobium sp. SCG-1 TaxID=2072936 RepID=UPI000CD6C40D|nr:hypothetical protein [Sphingobium sp. SCG-1]AUW60603.1 hypothetical protein C1T17_20565 [Sphingobium sp. SCG-1]